MKKALTFLLILFLAPVIAGIYGAVHDQLSYTISPEYFTRFKFLQFDMIVYEGQEINNPRVAVALVGLMATSWMGIPIGFILALASLGLPDRKTMLSKTAIAFLITISVTFIIGLIGLAYGYFYLSLKEKQYFDSWSISPYLIDFKHFISVGSMHNFSYFGGIIGVFFGALYLIFESNKSKR